MVSMAVTANAQSYSTAVGARLGFFNGITIKHFVNPTNAIEGIASFRWQGFVLTGLYEWQKPINGAPGLDYFLGFGGHVGFWDNRYYYWKNLNRADGNFTVAGFDFIAGLEYTFKEVPFNIGLDWKPAFNVIGDNHWWGDGTALSIRYTF
ncbi:MAG: hypothetical protein K0B15_04885 [Lentimicrobium sp.]|nr:hypothetical protein [Lentimicrobium sp.]